MSKVVTQNPQRPKSSKKKQPINDKPKKDVIEELKSVSELKAKIEEQEFRIEYLEKNLDPKVFEKKAGCTEQQPYTLFEDSLKSAEETIWKLRNGSTPKDNTDEFNKAKDEIKRLNNELKQKETTVENLKRDLNKAQSERDDLQKKQTETRPTSVSEKKTSAGSKKKELEIEALNEKVRNLENDLKGLSTEELNEANEKIQKLENVLKQNTEELNEANEKIQKLENELKQKIEDEKMTGDSQSNTSLPHEIKEKDAKTKDLQRELTSVRKDLEGKEEEIRRLKETKETEKKELEIQKKECLRLQDENKAIEKELEIQKKEFLRLKDENKAIEGELKTLKTKSESPMNTTKDNTGLQEEINNMNKKIDAKDAELRKKTSDIEEKRKEIETLKKSAHDAFTKLQTQEQKTKDLEEDCKKKLEKKDETINTLRREKTMEKTAPPGRDDVGVIKHQLTQATLEIDELKSRLSKMVGENLTNNNPNITDLSDENRPTKLAEIYSEMYDNEWTDAFEELEKQGSKEHAIISELLTILQDTVKFCGNMAQQYIEHLQNSASKLQETTSTENKFQKLHLLKELRKSYAPSLAEEVFSLYVQKGNLKFAKTPKVEAYTKSCIKLCWLMSVQDPAVVIDEVKTPSKFDGDRYRTYTKSGTTMEFVVWPTMLLHAGGPILMKGVAQCK